LAWVLWLQGLPKQAAAIDKQTIILARQLNHPYSLCYAQSHSMSLGRWMRQVESTRLLAEDTMTLADQYGFPLWMLSSSAFHGWSQVMQGQLAGIKPIQHAVNTVRAAMSGIEAFFLVLLVESYVHSGQIKDALSMINEALTVMDTRHDYFLKSEMIRLKGVCQLEISGHNAAEAEACFKEALVLSRCQGAKSLELRSTLSLADLWRQQGKSSDARRMLEKVYDSFTEGHDTHDLQQAANLLLVLV
jgi:predicted ATPase